MKNERPDENDDCEKVYHCTYLIHFSFHVFFSFESKLAMGEAGSYQKNCSIQLRRCQCVLELQLHIQYLMILDYSEQLTKLSTHFNVAEEAS